MVFGVPEHRHIPKSNKEQLYKNQQGKCNYCGIKLGIQYLDIDHKNPVARGGSDRITNLQLLCGPCNTRKGSLTDGEYRRKYKLPGSRTAKAPPSRPLSQKRFEKITKEKAAKRSKRRRNDAWF